MSQTQLTNKIADSTLERESVGQAAGKCSKKKMLGLAMSEIDYFMMRLVNDSSDGIHRYLPTSMLLKNIVRNC